MIYIVRHGQTDYNVEEKYARCFFEGEPQDGNYMNYKLNNCEILQYKND